MNRGARIIAWNCKGGFRRKQNFINSLNPDILIIPESERIEGIQMGLGETCPNSFIWEGDDPAKGIAIISYGAYKIKLHPDFDPSIKWVIPIIVSGPFDFLLLAVWTLPHSMDKSYVRPLIQAHLSYSHLFSGPALWAGDFNANPRLDRPHSKCKFHEFIDLSSRGGFKSLYHVQERSRHGDEKTPTFYLYHHKDKGHHIDYFFANDKFYNSGFQVSIGEAESWLSQSDHLPIICDVK